MARAPMAAADVGLADELAFERARVLRFCLRMTGNAEAAEDLAQETLLEAWRNPSTPSDPAGRSRWLFAIARNMCLRWARRHGREAARRAELATRLGGGDEETVCLEERIADDFDLEVELDRGELANLLDRAMALLPPETRQVLVERYVEESPQAETALRLGLSEGAVAMRLHRGKLALRRALLTDLREEAVAYGIAEPEGDGWRGTRIWCTFCGQHRLEGHFSEGRKVLRLRCAVCGYWSDSHQSVATNFRWDDVKGFRASLNRIVEWHRRNHLPGLLVGTSPCPFCTRPIPLRIEPIDNARFRRFELSTRCACGGIAREPHDWLVLCVPEAQRFWRAHQRIRLAATCFVEADGHPALVTTYESVADRARLDVVAAAETLRVLAVHREGASG